MEYVLLVIDVSGSMSSLCLDTGDTMHHAMIEAAMKLVASRAKASVPTGGLTVRFDVFNSRYEEDKATLVLPMGTAPAKIAADLSACEQALKRVDPEGATALYDAAIQAIQAAAEFPHTAGPAVVVLATDGNDNRSVHTRAAMTQTAIENKDRVRLVAIGCDDINDETSAALEQIVDATAGSAASDDAPAPPLSQPTYFPRSSSAGVQAAFEAVTVGLSQLSSSSSQGQSSLDADVVMGEEDDMVVVNPVTNHHPTSTGSGGDGGDYGDSLEQSTIFRSIQPPSLPPLQPPPPSLRRARTVGASATE